MKTILYLLILFFFNSIAFTQDPVVQWDKTIGGSGIDYARSICITADGGYLVGGISYSGISGDKTEAQIGAYDFWIIKLDADGNIEWQNTIGTTSHDYLVKVMQAADGGYIIGGYTSGGISGDKTEASMGLEDYWILKLDTDGNILWQNTIGGSAADILSDVEILPTGVIILSGTSSSGISGDKTSDNYGGTDYWLVKLNSLGEIIFQADYGGLDNDKLVKTIKRGSYYILAGYSNSGISGVKTEESNGGYDYWIIAIDELGNIFWQNTIGGDGSDFLYDIISWGTTGFLIAGTSYSDISGDKTALSENFTYASDIDYLMLEGCDYWIVRIDLYGNIIWEKTIGDYNFQYARNILRMDENKVLIAGYSGSNNNGFDLQITGIDSLGYRTWEKRLYGYSWEDTYNSLNQAVAIPGGGFFIAGSSEDGAGYVKSEDAIVEGVSDFWVLKMGPDTCSTFPVYADLDRDGFGGEYVTSVCELIGSEFVLNNDDCDDLRSNVNYTVDEMCDGIDNNCDGVVDEGLVSCNPGPEILWDKAFGGEGQDYVTSTIATSDGGFIIGGYTFSVSDDFPINNGGKDYCIIKLAESGTVEWTKVFGGNADDILKSIWQTDDGGYIIGGTSSSGISGDKTEAIIGEEDLWILKLDNTGAIEWQKTIGGNLEDELKSIESTSDGGYLVGANSYSGISGDKTTLNYGKSDYWILKLDASGSIEWQNSMGGDNWEDVSNVTELSGGESLVGGKSQSLINGNKTTANLGYDDIWLIKLTAEGDIIWQKSYGGTSVDECVKVLETSDGKYIVGGTSGSPISETKSENSFSNDYWILNLDTAGEVVWDNTIQATGYDFLYNLIMAPDSGFLLCGQSYSPIGIDKNESNAKKAYNPYNNTAFYYGEDYWIVKLDSLSNIEWQNTIGGSGDEYCVAVAVSSSTGKILIAGNSSSGISGDKTVNKLGHITEDIPPYAWNDVDVFFEDNDIWILQLENDFCVFATELCNGIDDNCNGLIDDDITESVSISAAGATTFCQGGSVMLNATYSGETVQWKRNGSNIPGATGNNYLVTHKGYYSCSTNSDCGAAVSAVIPVNVIKNPVAHIVADGPTIFCAGGSVTLTANAGAGLSYQWYSGSGIIAGATDITYVATSTSVYTCLVTKIASGCSKVSNVIYVSVPCKMGDELNTNELSFTIYPNPNTGTFTISATLDSSGDAAESSEIKIYNCFGQLIYSHQYNFSDGIINEKIHVENISTGIYFIRLFDGNFYTEQKLIIQ